MARILREICEVVEFYWLFKWFQARETVEDPLLSLRDTASLDLVVPIVFGLGRHRFTIF